MEACHLRQQIIDCQSHGLVIGGPGSGKTTIALEKAVVRIKEGMAPWQSVLFLSFSRAAVARVGEATRQQVPKEQRGMLSMQTFHSFFWTLLSTHGYLLGAPKLLQILLPADEKIEYGTIKKKDSHIGNITWENWLSERDRLFREDGKIAFDLFASKTLELLEGSKHIQGLVSRKYPLIIVDEAQDTDDNSWRCIELLSSSSQIICLADLEQQIFDHLPGVGPERITAIQSSLKPVEIDLGQQNFRSKGTEIAVFGQDLLLGKITNTPYRGVSSFAYNPKTSELSKILRMSIGMLHRAIRRATGNYAESIAILTHSGAAAAKLSLALNSGNKPVRHSLSIDETEVILTARFAAFLLEPKKEKDCLSDLAIAIDLLATAKKAAGLAITKQWQIWANKIRNGKVPKAGFVSAVSSVMDSLKQKKMSGDPAIDWSLVKRELRGTNNSHLLDVAKNLDYLVAFNRGKRISSGLGAIWERDNEYTGAREVLDMALAQDQILGGIDNPPGIQVMTIHKSKGKQFDGVLIVRDGRFEKEQGVVSSFIWWGDSAPFYRSKKILRVGVTRAKVHTLILEPFFPNCPIIGSYKL